MFNYKSIIVCLVLCSTSLFAHPAAVQSELTERSVATGQCTMLFATSLGTFATGFSFTDGGGRIGVVNTIDSPLVVTSKNDPNPAQFKNAKWTKTSLHFDGDVLSHRFVFDVDLYSDPAFTYFKLAVLGQFVYQDFRHLWLMPKVSFGLVCGTPGRPEVPVWQPKDYVGCTPDNLATC